MLIHDDNDWMWPTLHEIAECEWMEKASGMIDPLLESTRSFVSTEEPQDWLADWEWSSRDGE